MSKVMFKNQANNNQILSESNDSINEVWSNLPVLVIQNINTYLNMDDKKNMSLVCKNWLYSGLPELWKYFSFYLDDHSSTVQTWPEVELAEKYGYMFRHVEIRGEKISVDSVSKTYTQLSLFLEYLKASGTQLVSFELINIKKIFYHLTETENENLFRCTLDFIRTQNKLERVTFKNSFYTTEDGMKLLETLCNNSNNLKTLELSRFLNVKADNNETDSNSNQICKNLAQKFVNLKILVIDYSLMFENIFRSFQKLQYIIRNTPKRLSEIILSCDVSKREVYQGIPPIAWKDLLEICPDLKVRMTMFSSSSEVGNPIEMYLVEFIPVAELHIFILNLYYITFDHFLQLILCTKIKNHIESITFAYWWKIEDISIPLIPFFNACLKLTTFSIILIGQQSRGFKNLFDSLVNNRPVTLKRLAIDIHSITSVEYQQEVTALADEYCPLFAAIGLQVNLQAHMK